MSGEQVSLSSVDPDSIRSLLRRQIALQAQVKAFGGYMSPGSAVNKDAISVLNSGTLPDLYLNIQKRAIAGTAQHTYLIGLSAKDGQGLSVTEDISAAFPVKLLIGKTEANNQIVK